jgi:hypothetical protein
MQHKLHQHQDFQRSDAPIVCARARKNGRQSQSS